MLQRIATNWHLMRTIRLLIGVMVLVQAWEMKDWLLGSMGLWLTGMAVFNIGCCGTQVCVGGDTAPKASTDEINYEEVKADG